ncbi:MAG: EAL domain-containing protein [Clostridia bacterium]|nr:EAL domain-containing protein [Clostridia bacterium]
MTKALHLISHVLGFEKLSKYENEYLHESNIRSSSYMGGIVVLLEIWMLIRQTYSKIVPKYQAGGDLFELIVKYTSKYWLFLLIGLGVMLFCIFQKNKELSKGRFITLCVIGAACILYTGVLSLETFTKVSDSVTPVMANIMNTMLVSIYVLLFVIGAAILTYALFRYLKKKRIVILEHVTITSFTLVCLAFGVFVSYSDFWGGKEIICFLTMVFYVGCLLIYRPYITILILGASFLGFYEILLTFQNGLTFQAQEIVISGTTQKIISGDSVNYVTFFISLATICFAIYHGRLSEAKKAKALEKSAKEDVLTGMYNFNYFSELAKDRIKNLPDENISENVFLFLDVHNFKAFNDQRGFEAGDKFLISLGNNVSNIFSDSLCARQADDHFVIFTKTSDLEKRLNALNTIVHDYDDEILLGINCGAYHLSADREDPRLAIDRARYAAHLIKNRFQTIYAEYDKTMSEAYHKRLYIVNNIDNAVENGWIVPFYQPVVWSDTEELCGCEALARWMDPVYGQLFPGEFIPVLEEYRLIHKLDKSIFDSVCRDIKAAIDEGKPVVPVSLNFSRLDFELMDAVGELENIVSKYGISKNLIHVEVTESALTDNFSKLNEAMNRIKELGYSLWLDDFGSGYSSLNVLKDYQFDVIKIDMRFLSNFESSEKSRVLIDCIVQMANRINMLTLTEGVETEAQADFLDKIGCSRLQGYLFGKPIPKEKLYERIGNGELTVSEKQL